MTFKMIRIMSATLVAGLLASGAHAQSGAQPLILDTQSGIHTGVPGNVLQTGPVTGSGMVQARPMARLQELPQQEDQSTVVSPYIEVQPPGQGSGSRTTGARVTRPAHNAYALQQGGDTPRSSTGLVPSGSSGSKRGLSTSNGQGVTGTITTVPR
jgi:hypothetical protein